MQTTIIITEAGYAAGMRALDRYDRKTEARTITLATSDYTVISDDWTPSDSNGGAALFAGCV